MKLAKKMLACAMALAMVAALALTAFAAAPAIVMTTTDAVVGETVTVTVAGKDIAGLTSCDLEFHYDATALKCINVVGGTEDSMIPAAGNPAEGLVTCSTMYLTAATADATFVTIEFEVLKAGTSKIEVVVGSWDGIDAPATEALVITAVEAPTEPADKPAEDVVDTTKAPVDETEENIKNTGDAGVAAIAGVMAIAAVAFVATRKRDEE